MGFASAPVLAQADPTYGVVVPSSGAGYPLDVWLHGAGGNMGTQGDLWQAECGPEMGGADVPTQRWRLKRRPGGGVSVFVQGEPPGTKYDFWIGWKRRIDLTGSADPVHPYAERRIDAIVAHCLSLYPWLDGARVQCGGNSMGGCGTMSYAVKRPDRFVFCRASAPRWYPRGVLHWDAGGGVGGGGYRSLAGLGVGPFAAEPIVVQMVHDEPNSQVDYRAAYDVLAHLANPANPAPFVAWGFGATDTSGGMGRDGIAEALAALRAGGRGFACAWKAGGHSDAQSALNLISPPLGFAPSGSATYVQSMFGAGYPVCSQHTRDDDPLLADVGFINAGFEWRNVVEGAEAWSCEIRNRFYNDGTVTITPHSSVFAARPNQTISYVKDAWQSVSFTAGDPVPVPPVINFFRCAGMVTDPGGKQHVTVAPGTVIDLEWDCDAESVSLFGEAKPVVGSMQWTAPSEEAETLVILNAYRDGIEAPMLIHVFTDNPTLTIEERVTLLEARVTALEAA